MTNGPKKGSRPRGRGPKSMRAPKSMLHRFRNWLAHSKSRVVHKFDSLRTCVHPKSCTTAHTFEVSTRILRSTMTELTREHIRTFLSMPLQDLEFDKKVGKNFAEHDIHSVADLVCKYLTHIDKEDEFKEFLASTYEIGSVAARQLLEQIAERAIRIIKTQFPRMTKHQQKRLGQQLLKDRHKVSENGQRFVVM